MFDSDEDYFTKEAYKRGRSDALEQVFKELIALMEKPSSTLDKSTLDYFYGKVLEIEDP